MEPHTSLLCRAPDQAAVFDELGVRTCLQNASGWGKKLSFKFYFADFLFEIWSKYVTNLDGNAACIPGFLRTGSNTKK